MLFKNSVRTSERTPHFTITKINWLRCRSANTTTAQKRFVFNVQWMQNKCELRWPLQVATWEGGGRPQGDSTLGERTQSFLVLYDVKQVQAAEVSQRRTAVSSKFFIHAQTVGHRAPPLFFLSFFPSYCDVSQALSYFVSTIVSLLYTPAWAPRMWLTVSHSAADRTLTSFSPGQVNCC
jgi:hypothetical protein